MMVSKFYIVKNCIFQDDKYNIVEHYLFFSITEDKKNEQLNSLIHNNNTSYKNLPGFDQFETFSCRDCAKQQVIKLPVSLNTCSNNHTKLM